MHLAPSELAVIGLTCNLVGVFFLANSIIFRRPRRVLDEFFGVGAGSLAIVRDYALNKIQVVIGFLYLNLGFLLQAWAYIGAVPNRVPTAVVCGAIVALAGVFYLIGSIHSRRTFRRLLKEFFQKHQWSFTENMALTKEIGEFLGVRHTENMTVEDFVAAVREQLDLPRNEGDRPSVGVRPGGDRGRRLRDLAGR
jgi:hypothetical protein